MMTDPIADMMTRIRNANTIHAKTVTMPASLLKVGIAHILQEEGFIAASTVEPGTPASQLVLTLKYGQQGETVIQKIERISKPGKRVYAKAGDLKPVLRGMGIHILSTPKGIRSDRKARAENLGGEVLCRVY